MNKGIRIILSAAIFLSLFCVTACKSTKEKCEDGDLKACQELLEEASEQLNKELDKAQEKLKNLDY